MFGLIKRLFSEPKYCVYEVSINDEDSSLQQIKIPVLVGDDLVVVVVNGVTNSFLVDIVPDIVSRSMRDSIIANCGLSIDKMIDSDERVSVIDTGIEVGGLGPMSS